MKIAFAGCSFTWGDELENPEEQRFSRLVCNKLGSEEYNLAGRGWSNDILLHKFLKFCNSSEKPDVAVIQWTAISRWQAWDESQKDWEVLCTQKKYHLKLNAVRYYRNVYTHHHGIENYWKDVYLAEQYCKDNDIKLIMLDMDYKDLNDTRYFNGVNYVSPYQFLCKGYRQNIVGGLLPRPKKDRDAVWYEYYMENRHPNVKGHQIIADYVEKEILKA